MSRGQKRSPQAVAIFDWCSVHAASTAYAFLCVRERKEMQAAILSRKESPAVSSAGTEKEKIYTSGLLVNQNCSHSLSHSRTHSHIHLFPLRTATRETCLWKLVLISGSDAQFPCSLSRSLLTLPGQSSPRPISISTPTPSLSYSCFCT